MFRIQKHVCLNEIHPSTHFWPRTVLFLALVQVGQPGKVLPPLPFLALSPQKRQESLHTLLQLLSAVFFPFKPSCVYVRSLPKSWSECFCVSNLRFMSYNKHACVKRVISICQCWYCLVSALSCRCLRLKHSLCSLWFLDYAFHEDCETRHMNLSWAKGI